jgi:hypothetical protein
MQTENNYKKYLIGSLMFSPALLIAIILYFINDEPGFARLIAFLLLLPAGISVALLAAGTYRYFDTNKIAHNKDEIDQRAKNKKRSDWIAKLGLWVIISVLVTAIISYIVWWSMATFVH